MILEIVKVPGEAWQVHRVQGKQVDSWTMRTSLAVSTFVGTLLEHYDTDAEEEDNGGGPLAEAIAAAKLLPLPDPTEPEPGEEVRRQDSLSGGRGPGQSPGVASRGEEVKP